MNVYVHNDREVVVNSQATTLEMPLEKGGNNVKWTKKQSRVIVPATVIPKPVAEGKPLPASTPAPVK